MAPDSSRYLKVVVLSLCGHTNADTATGQNTRGGGGGCCRSVCRSRWVGWGEVGGQFEKNMFWCVLFWQSTRCFRLLESLPHGGGLGKRLTGWRRMKGKCPLKSAEGRLYRVVTNGQKPSAAVSERLYKSSGHCMSRRGKGERFALTHGVGGGRGGTGNEKSP